MIKSGKEETHIQESITKSIPETNNNEIPELPNQQLESLEDIQIQLTLEQREAAMCIILIFGEYNIHDITSLLLFKTAREYFGIPDEDSYKFMRKYENIDDVTLIDIICTIKSRKAKDFLLLTCYELIKPTENFESFDILSEIGYEKQEFIRLIFGKVNSEETLRKIAEIEDEVTKKVERILKNRNRGLGFCHIYVNKKKNIIGRLWH